MDQLEQTVELAKAVRMRAEVIRALEDDPFVLEHIRVSPTDDGEYHVCRVDEPGEILTCCEEEVVPPKKMEIESALVVLSDENACADCLALLAMALYTRGYNEM